MLKCPVERRRTRDEVTVLRDFDVNRDPKLFFFITPLVKVEPCGALRGRPCSVDSPWKVFR